MTTLAQVYLVGGAVRDQLLGLACHDKDYVVVGETPQHMLDLGFAPVGKDFPVFLHPETKEEYALARTERKTGKGYTGFSVNASTTVTLEEDLARRDLTINAMAMDAQGRIIDPFDGQHDLKSKVLRHTTDAFVEDPVRVLRIARFLARYGNEWQIHPATQHLIEQIYQQGELQNLVPERVWQELYKALGEKQPALFFNSLVDLGIFPEIANMRDIPQPPEHHPEGDVFTHTMLVLQRAAEQGYDTLTRFAALTHDFGKAPCFRQSGKLHGHEQVGVEYIKAFCERLRIPNQYRELACLTSDNHTRCHKLFELTPATLHKLLVKNLDALNHPVRFEQFLQACQCDAQGRGANFANMPYPQADAARKLVKALAEVDKKAVVQHALAAGKRGPQIGEAVRQAEIACIKQATQV